MGELTRLQHEDLGGGVATDLFFGDFLSALNGLYNGPKDQENNGRHVESIINTMDGIARQLRSAPKCYVYKDEDDADDEFSVKADKFDVGGIIATYAGENALGGLTVGATNYLWLNFSGAPSAIVAAFGSAWPAITVPHYKLGSIAQPASGPWLPSHFTPYMQTQVVNLHPGTRTVRVPFGFGSGASIPLCTVAAGARVTTRVLVDTAWNGTAPTVKVGDSGDDDRLMTTAINNLKAAGEYEGVRFNKYATQTALVAAMVNDSSSAGAGEFVLEIV